MKTKVAVILINYNGIEDTVECIDSVKKSNEPADIIVVDNSSRENQADKLQQTYDDIVVLKSIKNCGFSGGNNIGIKYALEKGYMYIVLLNNDTIIAENMIEFLMREADEKTITTPTMFYYSTPELVWYGGGQINRRTGNASHNTELSEVKKDPYNVTFATGCCMLFHREIFNKIGLLDESYFMYCEDTEICLRAQNMGITIKYVPKAKLWHKISSSTGSDESAFSIYYMTRNRLYIIKNYKTYFNWTAFYYTMVSRYIRMWQYRIKGKNGWKAFAKAINDYRKGIVGMVNVELDHKLEKKKSKNICLVTWFKSVNYGTCLQCYALSRFLMDAGYNVYVPESYKYYYGKEHPIETLKKIIFKLSQKITTLNTENKFLDLTDSIKNDYKIRYHKNLTFSYNKNNIYKFNNKKEFKKMVEDTDVFITGSDQIWNPSYVTPPFLLAFAPNKKKIAYASSLGVERLNEKQKRKYRRYLKTFDQIGVREQTAAVLLSEIIEKKIYTVLDPTFLLNGNQWASIAKDSKHPREDKSFIFCYFIGKKSTWVEQIEKIANKKKWEVIVALSESHVIPQNGRIVADAGVEDFLYYIKESRLVATDSFHAMALSINMNKDFVAYKRFSDESKNSQNSRVYDMLKMYKLDERIVENYLKLERVTDETIDYIQVNDILERSRAESINFIHNAIEKE